MKGGGGGGGGGGVVEGRALKCFDCNDLLAEEAS